MENKTNENMQKAAQMKGNATLPFGHHLGRGNKNSNNSTGRR